MRLYFAVLNGYVVYFFFQLLKRCTQHLRAVTPFRSAPKKSCICGHSVYLHPRLVNFAWHSETVNKISASFDHLLNYPKGIVLAVIVFHPPFLELGSN